MIGSSWDWRNAIVLGISVAWFSFEGWVWTDLQPGQLVRVALLNSGRHRSTKVELDSLSQRLAGFINRPNDQPTSQTFDVYWLWALALAQNPTCLDNQTIQSHVRKLDAQFVEWRNICVILLIDLATPLSACTTTNNDLAAFFARFFWSLQTNLQVPSLFSVTMFNF